MTHFPQAERSSQKLKIRPAISLLWSGDDLAPDTKTQFKEDELKLKCVEMRSEITEENRYSAIICSKKSTFKA